MGVLHRPARNAEVSGNERGPPADPPFILEAEAAKENEIAQQAYQAGMSAYKLRRDVKVALEKARLKKTKQANGDIDFQIGEEPREPMPVRYRTNDTSYESLGELLISNPGGILVERDELISLLRHLDRDDQS